MYQIGDQVVYGVHGVCRVVDLEERIVDKKCVIYLVLEPVGQGGSRYLVPTHSAAAMAKLRHMLSKEELEELLSSVQVHSDVWIEEENRRKQTYRELINGGDQRKLLQMVHTLCRHRELLRATGKKVHICDDTFLRDAEKRIVGEISIVMELSPEDAKKYFKEKLNEDA